MPMSSPSLTQLLDRVCEITPTIRAHAEEAERERRLATPVVDALRDKGLFDLWRPAAHGGYEVDPVTGMRVVEAVSRIDSAAGWNLMICLSTEPFGAWFPDAIARESFGAPGTIMGGSFNPPRRAVPVDGGYVVSGRTPFVSGAHQVDWINGLAHVIDGREVRLGPDGVPVTLMTLFPARDAEIIDSWHTMGMRGTGSHDVVVTDLFVPDERAVPYVALEHPGPAYTGPLYRLTVWPAVAVLAVPALGVAAAAVDALVELATAKTPAYTTRTIADRPVAAAQAAQADALVHAARAYLYQTFDEAYGRAVAGEPMTMADKARVQSAATNAVTAASEAVRLVHAAVGATGIRQEAPFERFFRDTHVLTQHAFVCASRYEDVGRFLLGREPEWGFFAF
jgi:alkylation response protein AidB-like acyl-CoA dehydrogenase